MKQTWIAPLALAIALACGPASGQSAYPPIPEIKYEAGADFLKLPWDMNFGDPVSVSVDNISGDIYVANRSGISGPATVLQCMRDGPNATSTNVRCDIGSWG